mmetsp:Transcript_27827/g.56207  ORF Transcript_27827/g.56207 Transcript_27827/m.56207 type:complete len:226 (-) Transcript_27827:1159-1836(-)
MRRKEFRKGHISSLWLDGLTQQHFAGVPKSVTLSSSSPSTFSPPSSSSSDIDTLLSSLSSSLVLPSVSPPFSCFSFTRFTSLPSGVNDIESALVVGTACLFSSEFSTGLLVTTDFGTNGSAFKRISTVLPGRSPFGVNPIIRAGEPTAVAPVGIGLSTTLPAPILALSPTWMFPKIFVPAPIRTSFPTLGCRSPDSFPVPPKVTPCKIVVPSPTVAVSPITTPVA